MPELLTSVELFAGAGGLALGLERAGFQAAALVEFDKNACATLRANFPDTPVIEGDVRGVDWSEIAAPGETDLVAGGPPCQPFSLAGSQRGEADERDMIPEFVRAVQGLRPKAFLMENVRGLLSPRHADYYRRVLERLAEPALGLRYTVTPNLVCAADYGVPQQRWRVLVIGIREDQNPEGFAFPEPTHSFEALLHSQYVTGEYWHRHPVPEDDRLPLNKPHARKLALVKQNGPGALLPWRTFRDATCDLGEIGPVDRSHHTRHALWREPIVNPPWKMHPTRPDLPANTVLASHSGSARFNMVQLPEGRARELTIPERLRAQTFPDTWQIIAAGRQSALKQLGNAVPVQLGQVAGNVIAAHLAAQRPAQGLAA
ncbi:DNA-cytosine methyltransferase [Segniliparus rotundus DSM 44985]|uniref:Cytosine-specific methyltransferase n=1 Tax=Segniliparus rotundus (strain ATCC BAA-972 / CDC 1076 / CIP 108378 / DSM 44985 / JCM 13578) TaxID=640132 RepID=D6ZFC0_SEGRD|nr:DNA (cytosine-5-)-methyltransferase [Segniliparus rotundus]ADG97644.1 DNA-cytosine methyltransferase [Segniliparus rotundus DSM 44985]